MSDFSHPLYGCWRKVERAFTHIQRTNQLLEAFYQRNEPIRSFHDDPAKGIRTIRIEVPNAESSVEIGITVGEALYDLRSALDYLACGLVRANGCPVTAQTGFPLFLKDNPGRINPVLKGIPKVARDLILELQPYNAVDPDEPDDTYLGALQVLSIIDKHDSVAFSDTLARVNFSAGAGWIVRRIKDGLEMDVPLSRPVL